MRAVWTPGKLYQDSEATRELKRGKQSERDTGEQTPGPSRTREREVTPRALAAGGEGTQVHGAWTWRWGRGNRPHIIFPTTV